MSTSELVDHSPQHSDPAPRLETASNLILIDNYDSFTWNVYQYLVLEGATVIVYRNDEISLEDLIAKRPTQLVISPGPGHPTTDAGISCEAVKYFSGKIPVLGVCMGEQCIFSAFGGRVDVTGEILHGKTSPLCHDGRGVYSGLEQGLPVTRYHSLAGTHSTLPECLEVSSWIDRGSQGHKVIMGVRHKEFLVEGVQFHPESILTAEGRVMLKNFLNMQGGTWKENKRLHAQQRTHAFVEGSLDNGSTINESMDERKNSILEKIFSLRKTAVEAQKQIPSQRLTDLQKAYALGLAPPQISFPERLRVSPFPLSLLAEIKRASPSKGAIALDICASAQARKYATAGASVISVLTEPEWFKGSIDDLHTVRQSLVGMLNRPAVLRKEFIFDEYQILEARLAGADTVLLIVKMLDLKLLHKLYKYSVSLKMEPLVEVNTEEEMKIAIELGAKVIGVNNRNLTSFEVDLETTSRLVHQVPEDTIVCALSGIAGPADVEAYRKNGVGGVLVGEALMRSTDVGAFVSELLGLIQPNELAFHDNHVLVKICGTRTPDAALAAIEAGADLIGMILVEGRTRYVPPEIALAISKIVHGSKKGLSWTRQSPEAGLSFRAKDFFVHNIDTLRSQRRALVVGVFQNQPLSHILTQIAVLDLDIVQLHGSEPIEWASLIPVPVFHRFEPTTAGLSTRGYHFLPLLDSAAGGTGQITDPTAVRDCLVPDPGLRVILAGGLNPDNVSDVLRNFGVIRRSIVAVDVSSGVESGGSQDLDKIRKFIKAAKSPERM